MRQTICLLSVVCTFAFACGGSANTGFIDSSNNGGGSLGGGNGSGGGGGGSLGNGGGGGSGGGGNTTVSVIYAHSDTELFSMNPTTRAVTDIGPFELGGSPPSGAVTDLAVDANGDVWVNTETQVFKATVPQSSGAVSLTLQTTLSGSGKFYALAFAPAGVLGSDEGLVGGDSNGELWYIDTSNANATPQDLGGFGTNSSGDTWELSGDLVFYTEGGAPTGLATIRSCTSKGTCTKSNDSLAAVDMTALAAAYTSHSPGSLLKGTYGSGTGYGDLFGLGAWGNSAYAFARASGGSPAQLIQIDGTTGVGTSLQQFPNITSGWSGAGVTTKAAISVPQPVN